MPIVRTKAREKMAVSRFDPEIYALRPWYHDFSSLGFDTSFLHVPLTNKERVQRALRLASSSLRRLWRANPSSPMSNEHVRSVREVFHRVPSSHLLNQPVKEQFLISFMNRALSDLGARPTCLELFSSDGYYSCRFKSAAPKARVTGVELDPNHVRRAETMVRRLGLEHIEFCQEDVWSFLQRASEPHDLVLCAGGLYHTNDPERLLQLIGRVGRTYVVIQSVTTLETEDRDYFVRPAPGWKHGCRFTHAWLRDRISDRSWQLTAEARTELPGNRRLGDRGSSFFLCRVA